MRLRRLWALAGLALIAVVAALVVLPASWLTRALPSHWPFALVAPTGTIWSGTAILALGPPATRRSLPDPIHWNWAFTPAPQLHLRHPWLKSPVTVVASITGLRISSDTLTLPAQALAPLDARIASIDPSGTLSLSWPALSFGASSPAAGTSLLQAEWRDAGSALSPVNPLGFYALRLQQGTGRTLALTLSTRNGPLMLEGQGSVTEKGTLDFKGTARAAPDASPQVVAALQDVLNALGPRQNELTLLNYR